MGHSKCHYFYTKGEFLRNLHAALFFFFEYFYSARMH